jgi:hypothetical protein
MDPRARALLGGRGGAPWGAAAAWLRVRSGCARPRRGPLLAGGAGLAAAGVFASTTLSSAEAQPPK